MASLQQVSGELEEARVEIRRLNQAVQNRQNAVDFSRSSLDEVQRDNDKLQNQVYRLLLELGQQRHS